MGGATLVLATIAVGGMDVNEFLGGILKKCKASANAIASFFFVLIGFCDIANETKSSIWDWSWWHCK